MYFEHILKCLCFVFLLKLVQCRQCRGKYKLKNGRNIRFFAQRRYIWHIRNHTVLSSGVLGESNEFWLTSFFMLYHNVRQEQNAFVISFIWLFLFFLWCWDRLNILFPMLPKENRDTPCNLGGFKVLHIIFYCYLITENEVSYYISHKCKFVYFIYKYKIIINNCLIY